MPRPVILLDQSFCRCYCIDEWHWRAIPKATERSSTRPLRSICNASVLRGAKIVWVCMSAYARDWLHHLDSMAGMWRGVLVLRCGLELHWEVSSADEVAGVPSLGFRRALGDVGLVFKRDLSLLHEPYRYTYCEGAVASSLQEQRDMRNASPSAEPMDESRACSLAATHTLLR